MVESKPQRIPIFKSVPVKARVHAVDAASSSPGEQPVPRSDKRPCPICKEDHMIYNCETFKGHSTGERREQVNQLGLCFNCLGRHRIRNCKSIVACRTCAQRHHTLLHDHDKRPNPPARAPESDPSASVNMVRPLHQNRVVLLATAQVIVWGALLAGSLMPARVERTGEKQKTAQPSGSTTKVVARELANPGGDPSYGLVERGSTVTHRNRGSHLNNPC
jgi:hypothetical protein